MRLNVFCRKLYISLCFHLLVNRMPNINCNKFKTTLFIFDLQELVYEEAISGKNYIVLIIPKKKKFVDKLVYVLIRLLKRIINFRNLCNKFS